MMRRSGRRAVLTSVVAATVAVVAIVGGIAPASAVEAAPGMPITEVGKNAGFSTSSARVPLVDSQMGVGAALRPGVPTKVLVTGAAGATSALLRIAVLDASSATVVSVDGSPALAVEAGSSASTAVLAPVVGGAVEVSSDAKADIRIEVLSTSTASSAPGAVVALPEPVIRADTSTGLAGRLSTVPVPVGVVGEGGVPAQDVRAVHATIDVTTDAADVLSIGGQSLPLRAGRNIVTTVLPVDDDGVLDAALRSGTGSFAVAIRGYVRGAPENLSASDVTGGFVPAAASDVVTSTVSDQRSSTIGTGGIADRSSSLVLVSSSPTADTTVLEVGQRHGRATGAVIDAGIGALPQLVVVPRGAEASLRRGSATVSWERVGDVLGTPTRSSDLDLQITSPRSSASIDLGQVGTFTIGGTVTSGTSVGSVSIASGGSTIGNAAVSSRGGSSTWSLDLAVPKSGDYTFDVTATDRTGHGVTRSVSVHVTLPDADETVVAADTKVVDSVTLAAVTGITDDSVTFAIDPGYVPGDVIVGAPTANAPQGFLRRVASVDLLDGKYVVHTMTASLTDAVQQGSADRNVDLVKAGGVSLRTDVEPGAHDTAGVEVIDGDLSPVQLLAPTGPQTRLRAAASDSDPAFTLDGTLERAVTVSAAYEWDGDKAKDFSKKGKDGLEQDRGRLTVSGGASVEASATMGFQLHVTIGIDVAWGWTPKVTLEEFSTILTRSTEAKLEGRAYVKADYELTRTLAEAKFASVTVPLGPVPVNVTASIDIAVGAEVHADGDVTLTWAAKTVQDYGFAYEHGAWVDKTTKPKMTNTPPRIGQGFQAKGHVEVLAGPDVGLDVLIYDAAGPRFEAAGRIGVAFDVQTPGDDEPERKAVAFEAFLEGDVAVKLELKVPIIDEVLVDVEILHSQKKHWTLFKWELPYSDLVSADPGTGTGGDDGETTDPNMPRPAPAPEFDASDLRVTLYWNNKSDMDLHVTEPAGNEIWYGSRGPTASNGTLDIDSNAGCTVSKPDEPGGVENVYWPNGVAAPAGRYLISVDRYSPCGMPDANWVVEVWRGDEMVLRQTGSAERSFAIEVEGSATSAPSASPSARSKLTAQGSGVRYLGDVDAPVSSATK